VLPSCRDGAERSYIVCETMRSCCSAALLDNSSRLGVAGANRRSAGDSRRGRRHRLKSVPLRKKAAGLRGLRPELQNLLATED
jgi:hypothetical protein